MTKSSKTGNALKPLLDLLRYMVRHRLLLITACTAAVLTPIFSVRATYLLKPSINDCIIPLIEHENPDLTGFIMVLMKMGLFYLLSAAMTFIQADAMTRVCHETIKDLRSDMFEHLQSLPLEYFDRNPRGKIMSAFNSDVLTLTTMLQQSIPLLISGAIAIVSILFAMLTLNVWITIIVLVYVLISTLISRFIIRNTAKYTRNTQESIREMNGLIEEMVEGQDVVKLFQKEESMSAQFRQRSHEQFDASVGAKTYSSMIFPISNGLSNTGLVVIAVFGTLMAIEGRTDLGTVCTFVQYYKQFHIPLVQVARQVGNVAAALAGTERIFAMLRESGECNEGTKMLPEAPLRSGIALRDVVFGYAPGKPVLRNLSLEVKPGQSVAFVGSSGAGKTTIANLINRFYDVNEGCITYDGDDIRTLDKYSLRGNIAMVLQDTHFFTGTIRENIRFGRLDATDEEIEEAAKLVNADFFIEHLPNRYDTYLESDGSILSDGQRQLLAITRAAISKAPILIMDEATSSVDTRTEQMIETGIRALMKSKTVFMIAHRLSTVRNSDIIVVLKDGRIVECGDHESLMKLRGMYYDLNTGSSELL